jgi:hypothetical protein
MSLRRFVYYSAAIGGWTAFLAWLVADVLFLDDGDGQRDRGAAWFWAIAGPALTGGLVGAAIAAGQNVVSGIANPRWERQFRRLVRGLIGGAAGGLIGGLLGALLYTCVEFPKTLTGLGIPRALGWAVMGLGIGGVEGIYERSRTKVKNGLIGGGVGGFLGGLLFGLIARPGVDVSSRALAFVILGISIGAWIGLTHVVLKEAWLTVLDGFQPGRQLILTQTVTVLGRGDHLPLPFLGYAGRDLESEHLKISRQPDGQYVVEDNHSRIGTSINGARIRGRMTLHDGDLIKLGSNLVRFECRGRASERGRAPAAAAAAGGGGRIVAPPPPPETPPGPGSDAAESPPRARPGPQPLPPLKDRGTPPDTPPRIPPPPPPPGN